MLISPPFLPPRGTDQTEEQWLEAAMRQPDSCLADTRSPEGSFPLSHALAWHTGLHLQAPRAGEGFLPVRAIADGTVVFARAPTRRNEHPDHAQNYDPFGDGCSNGAWTDNGCVIVRHRTSIGSLLATDRQRQRHEHETEVVFYSVYMHLSALGRTPPRGGTEVREWRADDPIWRKDEVGQPGCIYGRDGRIHFEIGLDDANLECLVGRRPAWVDPAAPTRAPQADGRIDSLFGSLYVYLPATTATHAGAEMPADHLRPAAPRTTLGQAVWVRISYDRGRCSFDTLSPRGVRIGQPRTDADGEYTLYEQACTRHAALPKAVRARSSPSGWYELLRFGRNIGRGPRADDKDPLPDDVAHWRRIVGPDGREVWADLNAAGSFKFSDADFPAVAGWNFVDDDTNPNDQRCDSARMLQLICDPDPGNEPRMERDELARRLGDDAVRRRLRRVFCRFPSEWDRSTIEARYGFVRELPGFQADLQAWARLDRHMRAMTFEDLPAEYLDAQWRVNPAVLIAALRSCGWFSLEEMASTFPRYPYYELRGGVQRCNTAGRPRTIFQISRSVAMARIGGHLPSLNRTMRKYGLQGRLRQAHFLAQVMLETDRWRTMREYGRGAESPNMPMARHYSAFYGRGVMQLTWAGNYREYGDYRSIPMLPETGLLYEDSRIRRDSTHWTGDPAGSDSVRIKWAPRFDPELLASFAQAACDSGGFYWVSKIVRRRAKGINRRCDVGQDPAVVGQVNILVNGGGNGYMERQAYAQYLFWVLMDSPGGRTSEVFVTPRGQIEVNFEMPQ